MTHFRPALVLLILLSLVTGLAYPLAMTGLAGAIFPKQAAGSLIEKDGHVIGSVLIGQPFTADQYFHGRPSATSAPDPADSSKTVDAPYNATNSTGSNAGPTAKTLIDRVQASTEALKKENPDAMKGAPVPVDLVTTSASGLDPHVSPAAADFQVPRVAKARGLSEEQLRELVAKHVEERFLGVLGEPVVNVLALNLALDELAPVAIKAETPSPDAAAEKPAEPFPPAMTPGSGDSTTPAPAPAAKP